MRCDEARSALSAWLDGECPAEEAAAVAAHVRSCAACATERAALECTRGLVASAGRLRAPQEWIRDALNAVSGTPVAAGAPRAARPRILSRPWAVSSLAAAAAVAVVVVSVRVLRMEDVGRVAPLAEPMTAPSGEAERQAGRDEKAAPVPAPAAETDREAVRLNQVEAPPGQAAPPVGQAARPQADLRPQSRSDAPRAKDDAAGPSLLREARPEPPPVSAVGVPVEGGAGAATVLLDKREAVLPTIAVALAQIHFAGEESGDALAGAAPAAPSATSQGKVLRVRVSLDPSNRILAADALDPAADRDAAALVTRLPGSWVDLEPAGRPAAPSSEAPAGPKPAGGQEAQPAPGFARASEFQKIAAAAAPAARQVILEIALPPPPSR